MKNPAKSSEKSNVAMLGIKRMNNNIPVMMVNWAGLFLIYYKSIEKDYCCLRKQRYYFIC